MLCWIWKRSFHICSEQRTICRVERREVGRHSLRTVNIDVGIISLSLVLWYEYFRNSICVGDTEVLILCATVMKWGPRVAVNVAHNLSLFFSSRDGIRPALGALGKPPRISLPFEESTAWLV